MPGDMIKIEVDDRKIRAKLDKLASASSDLTPAMREIAGVLADAVEQAFADEKDPATGKAWPDLKPATKKAREKKGHWPGKKLQVTGALASSIVPEHGSDFAQVTVGRNIPYAAIHQFGGKAGRGHAADIPARPFLGLSADDKDEIVRIIEDHIRRALR